MTLDNSHHSNRRNFLKATTAGTVAATISSSTTLQAFHNSVDDKLRIGLVGCGGRGTQAVFNALKADPNTEVTALADAFMDRVEICEKNLAGNPIADGRLNIQGKFAGFDCCDK